VPPWHGARVNDAFRALRVTAVRDRPIEPRRDYVLYWMIAARRTAASFALDHAIAHARALRRPLLVVEPLRIGYAWASDRLHAFVAQGMADNARAFAAAGITYLPYVEPSAGAGKGLLAALAGRACVVVTDEQPGFFLPRMVAAAARSIDVRLETVDGNGLLPLRAVTRAYPSAVTFRRELQRLLPTHLTVEPNAAPLARVPRELRGAEPPAAVTKRWPAATAALLAGTRDALAPLAIDHAVRPVAARGGSVAAHARLAAFVTERLPRYAESRNQPDDDVGSGLSPYLHFGHIGAHEIARAVWASANWDLSRVVGAKVTGSRAGWWGLPAAHEGFLDQLVTWRELGYGFCFHQRDYAGWSALPAWARETLDAHAKDPRPERYSAEAMEAAATADPIWNAAQRQLVADGVIHNYLRMLWGKKVLEWSRSPQDALALLVHLNNKYALDGRDPNSYTGILWTFGLFDRPWGPVRPIFGTIRYMSSTNTAKKLDLERYLARWAPQRTLL